MTRISGDVAALAECSLLNPNDPSSYADGGPCNVARACMLMRWTVRSVPRAFLAQAERPLARVRAWARQLRHETRERNCATALRVRS